MTRTKDGLEIKAQHAVASQFKTPGSITGYGGTIEQQQQMAQDEQNLFAKVWDKVKPKQQAGRGV
jgi:hypothetical protein